MTFLPNRRNVSTDKERCCLQNLEMQVRNRKHTLFLQMVLPARLGGIRIGFGVGQAATEMIGDFEVLKRTVSRASQASSFTAVICKMSNIPQKYVGGKAIQRNCYYKVLQRL